MTNMFAAVFYPFGLNDRDEGAQEVHAFGVSSDKQKLVDAIKSKMEEDEMVDLEVTEIDDETHISGSFDEEDDEEVYYVIKPVPSY